MALTKVTGHVVSPTSDYTINNVTGVAATFNNVTGVAATFTGNVSIGGTLTYQDVSNIDAVGIITAQKGIQITGDGLNVTSGIATFAGVIDANSAIVISEDNAIHFRGATDSDKDAILRASAGGGQLLINSRNDTILNIDSNNDGTDAHFAVAHGAATGSSNELFRVQENGDVRIGNTTQTFLDAARNLVIGGGSGSEGITIYSGSSDGGFIAFADGTSDPAYRMGQIIYSHNSNAMQFRTGGNTERLRIESDGDIVATGNLKTNNLPGRNLLINGAMRVNQKGNLTHNSDGYQVADMWWWGKYSTDQLVTTQANVTNDHPDEFDHSYKLSVATAETTLDNNEYGILRTRIEGQNLQHLKTGTASAKELTLSFWAKTASANSGDTYSVCIVMGDISGNDRIQYRTFTPTSTWQRFTMSFVGQTNNQIRNDHDYGLTLHYVLAAGSSKVTSANTTWSLNTGIKGVTGQSNFFDNTSNEFYVTGVQLEVGSIATEYEHKSYDEEIIRCLRYYYKYAYNSGTTSLGTGIAWSSAEIDVPMKFPVPMRIKPTSIEQGSGANYFQIEGGGQTPATYVDGNWSLQFSNNYGGNIYATPDQSLTPGRAHHVVMRQSAAYIAFVAEL